MTEFRVCAYTRRGQLVFEGIVHTSSEEEARQLAIDMIRKALAYRGLGPSKLAGLSWLGKVEVK